MFIRKVSKSNKNSSKVYESLHLVESVRTDKGPRQRLLLDLGEIDIPQEQYKELANCIEELLYGQQNLWPSDPEILDYAQEAVGRIRKKNAEVLPEEQQEPVFQQVDVNSIEASEARSIGPEYVCHSTYEDLKIGETLARSGLSPNALKLIEALVVGRLVTPGSERHTWDWMHRRSGLFELTGQPLRVSLSSLYRAGDALLKQKSSLERHLSYREKELFSLKEQFCFFDLTNTYFEGQAEKNSKAQRGRSKEKRADCKLETLALIIDEDGFAKHSQLYAGNQSEPETLPEMITSMKKQRAEFAQNRTVIMDAGIATKKNLEYLRENNFHYIVVHRGKSDFVPDDTQDMRVIRGDDHCKVEVKRHESDGETYLLCKSSARVGKDRGIRTAQETKFVEQLTIAKNGLTKKHGIKRYSRLLEKVGRLRQKYPKASKAYKVSVIPEEGKGENLKAKEITWSKKEAAKEESEFDGCYVLRTNREDLTEKEIWETYIMLTRIERAFRSLKSSLGLRPNFHQLEERADAHLFISVLAYHVLHSIEHRLRLSGDHRCWATIRDVLSTHQRLTIGYTTKSDQGETERSYLRLCTLAEPEHKEIYKKLGLKTDPLQKTQHTIK